MTEQESKDISTARMLVSLDALTEPNKALVTRICDGFVEKCAQLECLRAKAEDLMTWAEEAIRRKTCGRMGLCGTAACPQGYHCLERHMKDDVAALKTCLRVTGR